MEIVQLNLLEDFNTEVNLIFKYSCISFYIYLYTIGYIFRYKLQRRLKEISETSFFLYKAWGLQHCHIECLFQSFSKVQENPWTGDQQDGSAG